jgi:hypothetical protein
MTSSGKLCVVTLVRTDVSDGPIASITKVKRVGDLGITLAVTSNRSTLRRKKKEIFLRSVLRLLVTANVVVSSTILATLIMETKRSSETLVITRATRRCIPE